MIHCFSCAADLPDNLAYCLHCGAALDELPTVARQSTAPAETAVLPVRRSSAWWPLPVILAAVAIGLTYLAATDHQREQPVVASAPAGIVSAPSPQNIPPAQTPVPDRRKLSSSPAIEQRSEQRPAEQLPAAGNGKIYLRPGRNYVCRDGSSGWSVDYAISRACDRNGGVAYWQDETPGRWVRSANANIMPRRRTSAVNRPWYYNGNF